MRRTHAHRMGLAITLSLATVVLVLYACSEQPTEIMDPEANGANAAPGKSTLTLKGDSSTASGTLTSNRGGLVCTVTYASQRVTLSGTCSKTFKTGTVVLIRATPPANGGTVGWWGCDDAVTDDPLGCKVTLSGSKTINAKFAPPPNSHLLMVLGGAGGSGSVQSTPSGINCTITNGSSGAGCSASFGTSSSVQLQASAEAATTSRRGPVVGAKTSGAAWEVPAAPVQ